MIAILRSFVVRAAACARVAALACSVVTLALGAPPAGAQDVLPVPALSGRVVDETGSLGPGRAALEAKLAEVEGSTGSQIVVLVVPTTQPEDIASYAFRVAAAWKIGRHDVGDGILVVVARDDRHVRIEVAKALEGAVPDLAAYQIIDRVMRPAFKAGDYAGGLSAGVDQLAARIRGESLPLPDARGAKNGGSPFSGHGRNGGGPFNAILFAVFGLFVGAAILKALLGRTLGSVATGAGTAALVWALGAGLVLAGVAGVVVLVLSALSGRGGMSRSGTGLGGVANGLFLGSMLGGGGFGGRGFGGGGGGGGGFSSGGGGDFGGGGASGNW